MTFHLVDKDVGLYVSDERISRTPQFPLAYFKKIDDNWYKDQRTDNYYRYDTLLERILARKFDRSLPKAITDEDFIQFSNSKTIY